VVNSTYAATRESERPESSSWGAPAPGLVRIYVPRHCFWLLADGPCPRNRAINETGLVKT
jgi:hypothetical protein